MIGARGLDECGSGSSGAEHKRLGSMKRLELIPDIGSHRVKRCLGAQPKSKLTARCAQVNGNHALVAAVNECGHRAKADRPAAKHHNALSGLHLGLVYCMHTNSEGLGKCCNIQSNVIGNNM